MNEQTKSGKRGVSRGEDEMGGHPVGRSRNRSRADTLALADAHAASGVARLVKLLVRDGAGRGIVLVGETVVLGRLLVGLLLERRWWLSDTLQ